MIRYLLAAIGALGLLLAAGGGLWWMGSDADQHARLLQRAGLRQSPLAIATAALDVIESRRELVVQQVRFNSRQTSRKDLIPALPVDMLSSSKTLIVSGSVRYVIDLSTLTPESLSWVDNQLLIRRPPLRIAEPELHILDMEQMKEGQVVLWLTRAEPGLDKRNFASAIATFRSAAAADTLIETATVSADRILTDLFRLPLVAAGHKDVTVSVVD